jgi:ABC-2 type transport system permease protein
MFAFRPVTALTPLDSGITPYLGATIWMEAHWQDSAMHRPVDDSPLAGRWEMTAPARFVQIVWPLLIVLLGHGVFSRERERGTLRLILAQRAGLGPIVLAKAVVMMVVALFPVLVLQSAVPLTALLAGLPLPGGGLSRWAGMIAVSLLYLLFWVLLVLAVSALSRTSSCSLATLLALWMMLGLVLPRAAASWAALRAPTIAQETMNRQIRDEIREYEGVDRAERTKRRLLRQYGFTGAGSLPLNWYGIFRQEGEDHGNQLFDRVWGMLYAQYFEQQHWIALSAPLSPAIAFECASTHLAGTDVEHDRHFVQAAERHRRLMQTLINRELTGLRTSEGTRPLSNRELWSRIPPFVYHVPPPGAVPGHLGATCAALLGHVLGGAGLLIFAVHRAERSA